MSKFSVCFCTVPNAVVGKKIATQLLEKKLAACVNIIPGVTSIYVWKGNVECDDELMLKIKTRATLVDQLCAAVRTLHPYDVCEVVAVPIEGGNPPYLQWLDESMAKSVPPSAD